MPQPQGDYVPASCQPRVPCSALVFTAGMTPRRDGVLTVTGLVGAEVSVAAAAQAAGLAARNALSAAAGAAGGVKHLRALLRLSVFIACAEGFTDLSKVADGASAALAAALPELGAPARTAIGVRALPGGAPVEVELTAAYGRHASDKENPV
ncbi:Rid family hydrolase [Sinosporangium siamense]|uniref:Rid family hydrolase n=1 Tax=Sinosporangium siamense TaxID=1367973 RepID=UPI0035E71F86